MTETTFTAPPAPVRTGGAFVVGSFMFAHFTHHVSNSLLTPLLPVIRDSLALTYTQSGFLVSAFTLASGLSQAPIGALADRVSGRTVVAAGLVATTLCMLAIGLSAEYWQLLLLLVALGTIAGTYHAPAAALLSRAFPRDKLGGALGMHTVGGNFSFFATPLVAGGLVAMTLTWRTPYLAFAVAPLLSAVFLWATAPAASPGGGRRPSSLRDVAAVFRLAGPLLTAAIAYQLLYAALTAFLGLYLVDVRGIDPAVSAFVVALPYLGGLLGSPLGGRLSDRYGRRPVIVLSLIALGPLLLLLTVVPLPLVFPLLALIGLLATARMPVLESLLLDSAPEERRATTLGAYYLASQEVGGFGAPLLGALAGTAGMNAAFTGVAAGAAGLSLLMLALYRRL